ncbi:hypothetical protein FRC09_001681 [Ceratobasidium sp. 395]|nr:hypothetical protein FRC09_001681 [Ceratobasidium sp. 395]
MNSSKARAQKTEETIISVPDSEATIERKEDTKFVTARANKRRQVLRELIDELIQEQDHGERKGKDRATRTKDISYSTAFHRQPSDEVEGLDKIQRFGDVVTRLDIKLQTLADAVRQLGSSLAMFSAAHRVKVQLQKVSAIFHENVAENLFGIVPSTSHTSSVHGKRTGTIWHRKTASYLAAPCNPAVRELEDLPMELESLATDLRALIDSLQGLPECREQPIATLEADLKVSLARDASAVLGDIAQLRSGICSIMHHAYEILKVNCFRQLDTPSVAHYINELTVDLAMHIEAIVISLNNFIKVGVPTIAAQQAVAAARLQNLSTVATFLSAVTATMLQQALSTLRANNNVLSFETESAVVAGALGEAYTFGVPCVLTFLGGLCAFTYSSDQSPIVNIVVTVLTIVTSLSLLSVGIWLGIERLMFARTGGLRTLNDLVASWVPGESREKVLLEASRKRQLVQELLVGDIKRTTSPVSVGSDEGVDINQPAKDHEREDDDEGIESTMPRAVDNLQPGATPGLPNVESCTRTPSIQPDLEMGVVGPEIGATTGAGQERFRQASRRLINVLRVARSLRSTNDLAQLNPSNNQLQLHFSQGGSGHAQGPMSPTRSTRDRQLDHRVHPRPNLTRIQGRVKMLRDLRPGPAFSEHMALIEHLQFSPNGRFLATCSLDEAALIWKVGSGPHDELEVLHKLVHTSPIRQVAWSPREGGQLLTKQQQAVNTGECKAMINRERNVQSVAWMPDGLGFVSVEWRTKTRSQEAENPTRYLDRILGSDLLILDTEGTIKSSHFLERLQVWSTVVTPDEERVVAVATLTCSAANLRPIKSRNEKRILICNLKTSTIEHQVPLLQEARYVSLTQQGDYALVSYQNKAPPQAWRIVSFKRAQVCRLFLAHTYFAKRPVDFAGPSYFGGMEDSLILCASKGGEIFIWERESGMLLHSLKAPDKELVNLAWNYSSLNGLMFASAAHDGMVRIWRTIAPSSPMPAFGSLFDPVRTESPISTQPGLSGLADLPEENEALITPVPPTQ